MLATYRNQLREYRALQEELTPWTHAFQERHGRKPRLSDVEHTGVYLHAEAQICQQSTVLSTVSHKRPYCKMLPFCYPYIPTASWTFGRLVDAASQ